jgi:hypothetical protein
MNIASTFNGLNVLHRDLQESQNLLKKEYTKFF